MTDSMNIPEIETLSYHSSLCKCPECEKNPVSKPEQPKDGILVPIFVPNQLIEHLPSAPREGKEKTTPDIEPKTKVENKESVDQQLCKKCQVVNCSCRAVILKDPEQPNTNAMLIQTIQGLTTAILHDISKLPESELKTDALEDIDIFEKTTLFDLQKEYE